MNNTQIKYLKDYKQLDYLVDTIELQFEITLGKTIVTSKTQYYLNDKHGEPGILELNGDANLLEIKLDDQVITNYTLNDNLLIISQVPEKFSLTIKTEVYPQLNKSCMGLYESNNNLFTQCEPEGFRHITYYQDRPDVMAIFTTTIIADAQLYPVMLSNGNKSYQQKQENGLTKLVWVDPFRKPSYLFALVAGKFSNLYASHTTKSGKSVGVYVYSEAKSIGQCHHALESAKRAMQWDEDRFNLEYDLDNYIIVVSNDFNMGAMENKGLNIFNTKYVLADTLTATDADFVAVEAVVGHEYFHNWTGNRVTCRDWFQLSLKEGLTVFRDQEFTADLHSRSVTRIRDIKKLIQLQFAEDASPLAHSVRPESYMKIDNFYTMTVYEKGAELVRMYQTILGKEGFNKGLALYFQRHDGFAVTCDDFCRAMQEANNYDLTQFMLWYSQAGTPQVNVTEQYNETTEEYTLTFTQFTRDTPNQTNKKPFLIPICIELLDNEGNKLPLSITTGKWLNSENRTILLLNEVTNQYVFKNCTKQPIPSLLREMSAPIKLNFPYQEHQLLLIAAYDTDFYTRWDALQTIFKQLIVSIYHKADFLLNNQQMSNLISALTLIVNDTKLDGSIKSLLLSLPKFSEIALTLDGVDVKNLDLAIKQLNKYIANNLESHWHQAYINNFDNDKSFTSIANRDLKNCALRYLMLTNNRDKYLTLVEKQFDKAETMTDKIGALTAINNYNTPLRFELFSQFEYIYASYELVMDKWFTLQSQSKISSTLAFIQTLVNHRLFNKTNPNKLYALLRGFTDNYTYFNTDTGYAFICNEIIRIDDFNSSVASRIAHGFSNITSLSVEYQEMAKIHLMRILAKPNLSTEVYEIINKIVEELKQD